MFAVDILQAHPVSVPLPPSLRIEKAKAVQGIMNGGNLRQDTFINRGFRSNHWGTHQTVFSALVSMAGGASKEAA